jgi:ketosteroid isomerase-like protein
MTAAESPAVPDAGAIWLAYNDAENHHDLERTTQLVSDALVVVVNGAAAVGSAADDEAAMAELFATYPDYRRDVDEIVSSGDRAVVRWRMRGSHRDGGAALDVAGCSVITVEAGRITHAYLYYDATALDAVLGRAAGSR